MLQSMRTVPRHDLHPWHAQFALLALIWGSSFLFIKLAVQDLTAVQVSFGRIALGALAVGAVLLATGGRLPAPGRVWGHLFVAGLLMNALPFTLFAYGEEHLSSVIAGLWNATTPLFALLAAPLVLGRHAARASAATGRQVALGVALGFLGVIVMLDPFGDAPRSEWLAHAALLTAAASYGVGGAYIRRFLSGTQLTGLALSTAQLGLAAIPLALLLPVSGGMPSGVGAVAAASVVALGVLSSGLAYVLYHGVIRRAGPTVASTVTYVMPIVSTLLGVLLLDEALTVPIVVGGGVVMAGVLTCARAPARARRLRRASAA